MPCGTVQYWIAPKPTRMQDTVMDNAMILSERSHDSRQNLRWLAWEKKNRRGDRIADKRMKLVFAVVAVILLILIAHALTQVNVRPSFVEKGPSVACRWTTGSSHGCPSGSGYQGFFERAV